MCLGHALVHLGGVGVGTPGPAHVCDIPRFGKIGAQFRRGNARGGYNSDDITRVGVGGGGGGVEPGGVMTE